MRNLLRSTAATSATRIMSKYSIALMHVDMTNVEMMMDSTVRNVR